jgi:hypothetical protein
MQYWVESRKRGFAQGITHSFSRLGNALTPFLIVGLMAAVGWRGSLSSSDSRFRLGRGVVLVFP